MRSIVRTFVFRVASRGPAAVAATLAVVFATVACGGNDGSATADTLPLADAAVDDLAASGDTVEAALTFRAVVGDRPFACGTVYDRVGKGSTTAELLDWRMYVHDIRLLRQGAGGMVEVPVELVQDGVWQYRNLVLLDFEDRVGECTNGTAPTNAEARFRAPAATYRGVRFRIGVPEELNHVDVATAPSPLNLSGLYWNWTGGYKFIRADAKTPGLPSYNLHVGATGCNAPDPQSPVTCTRKNVAEIELTNFDPLSAPVVLDYAALMQDTDLDSNTADTPMGCMSAPDDPDCQAIFANLGVNFQTGAADASRQAFARVK